MFLIDAVKPKVEKKFKTCFIFLRLFKRVELEAYKIKPVLFLFAIGLLAATKTLFKETRKLYYFVLFLILMQLTSFNLW